MKQNNTEHKEAFTGGDWSINHFINEFSIHSYKHGGVCKIPFSNIKGDITEAGAEANAALLVEAKNMYYALLDAESKLEMFSESDSFDEEDKKVLNNISAIINRINNNQ